MAESKTNTLANSGAVASAQGNVEPQAGGRDSARADAAPTVDDNPGTVPGPGALIDGKYRVERLLARGGMGVVYAATHTVSGKKVALKWMLPALGQIKGARERFLQEACATARIAHPNIVDIYDVGSESGSAYLVMEYLRGETLADRMCRERISVTDAIALLMPALRGVAAAHAHGVIHRDLKPENIFLCCTEQGEDLEPKVLDFGISKITTDEVRNLALTHSGAVLGTPYYMSPEQVRGSRDIDARADVYAFGVILFEALTGERPFDAETYNELILKIATEPLPNAAELNPELDPRLIAIVERAMARDPNERFANIKALALALEPFAGGVRFRSMHTLSNHQRASGAHEVVSDDAAATAQSTPDSVPPPEAAAHTAMQVPGRRGTGLAVGTAFMALLTCAGIAVYFLRHPEAPASHEPPDTSAATAQPRANAPRAPAGEVRSAAPETDRASADPLPSATQVQAERPSSAQPSRSDAAEASHLQPQAEQAVPSRRAQQPGSGGARRARSPHIALDPAPPEPLRPATAPAPVVVRALPNDWDRRLDENRASGTAVHMPAGHIDLSDFR